MGWVVYSRSNGRLRRYTAHESAAKGMVTRNNRAAIVTVLSGKLGWGTTAEWAYCSWADFESVLQEHYRRDSWQYLRG